MRRLMAVKDSGDALWPLRTLFEAGAIGALPDGQLLEQFANGRGEPRERAFAALVARHGPMVLRVCRSVLRDEGAAEDAFQATFLALARKAGSLRARETLAPWLHQAAYRAAAHDRSATSRRRSHERAAAATRPESVAPHQGGDVEVETIIHEEIDRLPGRFRVAVVLCDLDGQTHEQAARHLGCAVGTVKSRLARGRTRLRGRLVRRGVAPAQATAIASAVGAARAAVPTGLAELTVLHATTAGVVPASVAAITEGVLRSMFLSRVGLVMTAATVAATIAAGAVALAQSGIGRPRDGAGPPRRVGPTGWTYHILVSRDGEPPRQVAVVEMSGDAPIRVDAPGATILIQPKRDGQAAAAKRPAEIAAPAGRDRDGASPPATNPPRSPTGQEHRPIVFASPKVMDVDLTDSYIGRIHSHRHIEVRTLVSGTLNEARVREGQAVKKGDLMFRIEPAPGEPRPDARFLEPTAPFDGLIGRLQKQPGSVVQEGDILTTLSDNAVMWVYFKVPERQYLEDRAHPKELGQRKVELILANHTRFPHPGRIGATEAEFDKETGTILYRADFPNPDGLLRHGQSGTIRIHRTVPGAVVIPQQATFEINDQRYVYVVDEGGVAHRREIAVRDETEDLFVIRNGVGVGDRIIVEGIRQVRDGEKVESELRHPGR